MSEHSILSPSSAHRRVRCLGSLAACKGIPNPNSSYAAEGTAYHLISSMCLETGGNAADYVGQTVHVLKSGSAVLAPLGQPNAAAEFSFVIDEENAAYAQVYIDAIRRLPGEKMYEVRIDTSVVVGVEGQGGTGDAVTLDYENLTIHVDDLKFGRGETVYADGNEQCIEYGAGALWMFDMLAEWKYVKVGIHMPRLRFYDERTYTVDELREWITRNRPLEQEAYRLWKEGTPAEIRAAMKPSPKGCRWCPLSGKCAAQSEEIMNQFPVSAPAADTRLTMTDEQLNDARNRVDEIEKWCKAVKEEAHLRAMQGATFADWELVVGNAGRRAWKDAKSAEATLVAAVGEEAFEPRSIISPAEADKLLNKKKHPEAEKRQMAWIDLVGDIHQAPAGKSLERKGQPGKVAVTVQRLEFTVGGGS